MLGHIWDNFGTILGPFWDPFGITLAAFWEHFGTIWGPFGGIWGPFWALGALLGAQEGPKSAQERQNVDFEMI